jgi:hypothetical protein
MTRKELYEALVAYCGERDCNEGSDGEREGCTECYIDEARMRLQDLLFGCMEGMNEKHS